MLSHASKLAGWLTKTLDRVSAADRQQWRWVELSTLQYSLYNVTNVACLIRFVCSLQLLSKLLQKTNIICFLLLFILNIIDCEFFHIVNVDAFVAFYRVKCVSLGKDHMKNKINMIIIIIAYIFSFQVKDSTIQIFEWCILYSYLL